MKTPKLKKTRRTKARRGGKRSDTRPETANKASRKDRLFDELFNTYHNRVYYITRRYTYNDDDALDLVQEIFIKAYRALDALDSESNYGPWIYRIAVNHCIDKLRRKSRPEFSYDEMLENGGALADSRVTAPDDLYGSDLRREILKLVDKLSPEHRAVLLLHCMENLPYKQIARALKCSIGTVMSRLHYARKYLKQSMQVHAVI